MMFRRRQVCFLALFFVFSCVLLTLCNVNAYEHRKRKADNLLLSLEEEVLSNEGLFGHGQAVKKERRTFYETYNKEPTTNLHHLPRPHLLTLKNKKIRKLDFHTHHNIIKRALEKSNLIQGSSRIQGTDNVLRPHMVFEYSDYQTPDPFREDVAVDTELLTVNLVNRPENSDLILSASNDSFVAKWNGGNSVSIRTAKILDADDNRGQYIFQVWTKVKGSDETASTTIRVTTLNTNDEPPRFTKSIYTSSVDEKAKPGAIVATVVASDKDRDNVKYSFATATGQHVKTERMFVIEEFDGVIRLVNDPLKIDFLEDKYELNVRAVDDGSCCTGGSAIQHTGSTLVVVSIIDINDHKPEFKNCQDLSPSVKENEPAGTFVIQVVATDDDRGPNKELNYSIVMQPDQRESNFRIGLKDGTITTNIEFDREAENGKIVSLTVKATDNGSPPLEGLCTFRVNILDVNDNAPQFIRDSYQQKITQNKKVRDDLFHVFATDRDADKNAMIVYSLEPKNNNNDLDYFLINPDSGKISLKKQLSSQTNFNFYVIATDKGEPPLSSPRVDVHVEVLRENVHVPEWVTATDRQIEIPENAQIGTLVATLEANSGIPYKSKVTYRLLKGKSEQTNKNNIFVISPSTNDDGKDVVLITLNKVLDYETIAEYNLTVEAQNELQLGSEATIYIRLQDVNDEIPIFNEIETAIVLEQEKEGTRVVTIVAHDKDATPLFRKVSYTLTSGNENFSINSDTGEVTTNVVFDREKQSQYLIQVEAKDGAPSARPGKQPGEHNTLNKDLWIQIGDINDNAPVFEHTIYKASVKENEDTNHVITIVTANDPDVSASLLYRLTGGNDQGAFDVIEDSGAIHVAGNIDYETKDKYFLVLVVTDGLHEASTTVEVTVEDVNDMPPVFNQTSYEVTLIEEETENLPRKLVQVYAVDGDKDRPKNIIYFLSGEGTKEPNKYFDINKDTGEISVLHGLDRDLPYGRPIWRFNALASDEGGGQGSLTGFAEVIILLKDINDNAPIFPEPIYKGYVKENQPSEVKVMVMSAMDYDDGPNAVVKYKILQNARKDNKDVFSIHRDDATITTAICCLDRETDDQYTIVIVASDVGLKSGTGTATIIVEDVNDSPPRFDRDVYDITIPKTNGNIVKFDEPALIVKVLDDDLPDTNKNYFLIEPKSGPGWDRFTIVPRYPDEGELKVKLSLDYENPEHRKGFHFRIIVDDSGGLSNDSDRMATAEVKIQLIDINDNAPEFENNFINVSVSEATSTGTSIAKFKATDRDNDGNSAVKYEIEKATNRRHHFSILSDGTVNIQRRLDREREENHIVHILAIDDGYPAKTSTATLAVIVTDINDNAPMFEQNIYKASVKENEDTNHVITIVTANDPDVSASLLYRLTGGNDQGAFDVIEDSGAIHVAGNINYETKDKYFLVLVVTDGLHEASTTVEVTVEDVNDMPPVFNQTSYEVTLIEEETENLPRKLVQVYAVDGDKDRPKNIIYFLSGEGTKEPNKYFDINKDTGEISVLHGLDRDLPYGRPIWRFNALASDEGGGQGSLTGFAEVILHLKDINDNAPIFLEPIYKGYVKENQPSEVKVMVMSAMDYDDGPNAVVKYKILQNARKDNKDVFSIDRDDATITTAICCLNRETDDHQYTIVIVASDVGLKSGTGTATIIVEDVNDSPPRFDRDVYDITIPETNGNIVKFDEPALIVKVLDDDLPDTNKNYFLIEPKSGPGWDRFTIVPRYPDEGELKVKLSLDYENPEHRKGFHFRIIVDDSGGLSNDSDRMATAEVKIQLIDINENAPEFENNFVNVSVSEATSTGTSIAKFKATDRDNDGNSAVKYEIEKATNRRRHFSILSDGTVNIQRPLDREREENHIVHILAIDDGYPAKTSTATLAVIVTDINDNAPELCNRFEGLVPENSGGQFPERVLDMESKRPLVIEACDRDDEVAGNGAPFVFSMDPQASQTILDTFQIDNQQPRTANVNVLRQLDREEQKRYKIPIIISDSGNPPMTVTSTLTVIIGDDNDNPMTDGKTDIMVYAFKGKTTTNEIIGRVHATDEDDWDWMNKTYSWVGSAPSNFTLNETSGEITMLKNTREGVYTFTVQIRDYVRDENAKSIVTVTIKPITEETVLKSGSIRIKDMTEEEFIEKSVKGGLSNREMLRNKIAEILGTNDVEIFTVMKSNRLGMLDVRYAACGSSYYKPEKMNGILSQRTTDIEKDLEIEIEMIGIDECLYEFVNCESSCSNELVIQDKPYTVSAKNTALVGIRAFVQANCICAAREGFHHETCKWNSCYNGGTCKLAHNGIKCSCMRGFDGPRCQQTTRSFNGDGYAWFSPLSLCENSHLSLEFITEKSDGLIFYNGPISEPLSSTELVQDFMSLELVGGKPRLLVDYGSGTAEIVVSESKLLNDGEWHRIDVSWEPELVTLTVDLCIDISANVKDGESSATERIRCEASGTPLGFNEFLNVNAPLQLGGVLHEPLMKYNWEHRHNSLGFNGCIKNFIHNSDMYDLGNPGKQLSTISGCPRVDVSCQKNDIIHPCSNGYCAGNMKDSAKCICYPGYKDDKCDTKTIPSMFKNDSFVKYLFNSVSNHENKFKSEIQLRFRADLPNGELMHVQGNQHEFMLLELKDRKLQFRYNLNERDKLNEHTVQLPSFQANDGYWHTVKVIRYGASATLSVDGGGGKFYNELINPNDIHQLITVPDDGIILGGRKDFLSGEVADYQNGCLDDVRYDRFTQHLPMPPAELESNYARVDNYSRYSIESGCDPKICEDVVCPENMVCENLFFTSDCRCKPGFTKDEKEICYPAKTSTATLAVTVTYTNDNAPELCKRFDGLVPENSVGPFPERVLDMESKRPLVIEACDRDDEVTGNGAPFVFSMDPQASQTILDTFQIDNQQPRTANVNVLKQLDREEQKRYKIPIIISDSGNPPMTGTSTLTVMVGDDNDNEMTDGKTDITVYAFKVIFKINVHYSFCY